MKKEYVEILFEDVKEKFELILEGHEGLRHEIRDVRQEMNEKFELVDVKIGALNKKIDHVAADLNAKIDHVAADLGSRIDHVAADLGSKIDNVAADLSSHRADTESHHRGYKVSE